CNRGRFARRFRLLNLRFAALIDPDLGVVKGVVIEWTESVSFLSKRAAEALHQRYFVADAADTAALPTFGLQRMNARGTDDDGLVRLILFGPEHGQLPAELVVAACAVQLMHVGRRKFDRTKLGLGFFRVNLFNPEEVVHVDLFAKGKAVE